MEPLQSLGLGNAGSIRFLWSLPCWTLFCSPWALAPSPCSPPTRPDASGSDAIMLDLILGGAVAAALLLYLLWALLRPEDL